MIPYAQPKRIECLDSIRGLAAIAVLLRHIMGAFEWPAGLAVWINIPLVNILFDGRSAVTMFFVLSGFVLAHPYLAPSEGGAAPRRLFILTFYLRRVIRIWIPWAFAFLLSILASRYLLRNYATIPPISEWLSGFWHADLTAENVVRQSTFTQHDASQQLLPQDWSLGVELKGSALVPLFVFFARRFIPGIAASAVLLLLFVPTGAYYVSFAIGVLAAQQHWRIGASLRALPTTAKYAILITGILLYQSRLAADRIWGITENVDRIVWCISSLGCALILAGVLSSRRIQGKLNLPIFAILGRISFSVYLLQFIVILCLLPPVVRLLDVAGIDSWILLLIAAEGAGVLITSVLALGMFYAIERPSIELGRRLTRLIQARLVKSPQ